MLKFAKSIFHGWLPQWYAIGTISELANKHKLNHVHQALWSIATALLHLLAKGTKNIPKVVIFLSHDLQWTTFRAILS